MVYNNTTKYTYDVSVVGAVVSAVLSFVPSVHVVVSNISATADTLHGTGGGAITRPLFLSFSTTVVRTSPSPF